MTGEFVGENSAKVRFRGPGRWSVIVGQVEVRDASIKGSQNQFTRLFELEILAKIVPEPKREPGQFESTASATGIELRCVVAIRIRGVGHDLIEVRNPELEREIGGLGALGGGFCLASFSPFSIVGSA